MKNILVPVESHAGLPHAFHVARLLGQRFGSYLEGIALGPDLPDLVAFDMPVSWTANDETLWRELAAQGRARFETYMQSHGVPPHQKDVHDLSWGWAGPSAFSDTHVGTYGRIFDVTVLGRPGHARGEARMATAEAALFESGRPILLAPPPDAPQPATLGETIVIAWNQSMETARAARGALLMLLQAKRVVVLTISEWLVEGPTGEQMAERLRGHGIPAEAVTRSAKGKAHGEAILAETHALGGDLLIKGAYTQSRLRQMIFGGATSHILTRADLPVLMAA